MTKGSVQEEMKVQRQILPVFQGGTKEKTCQRTTRSIQQYGYFWYSNLISCLFLIRKYWVHYVAGSKCSAKDRYIFIYIKRRGWPACGLEHHTCCPHVVLKDLRLPPPILLLVATVCPMLHLRRLSHENVPVSPPHSCTAHPNVYPVCV